MAAALTKHDETHFTECLDAISARDNRQFAQAATSTIST